MSAPKTALPLLQDASLLSGAGIGLARGRVHEVFGMSGRSFAAMVAGASMAGGDKGVLWIRPAHERRMLNPYGLARFLDPDNLLMAYCVRPPDLLWAMEEALRLGAVGLVIAELKTPPDLKVSRRLQLAAEAGGAIGLFLVDDTPVANAAETRWFCAPRPSAPRSSAPWPSAKAGIEKDSTGWRLSLIKNKKGTLGAWEIEWDAASRRIIVVSKLASGSDGAPWHAAGSSKPLCHRGGGEGGIAALLPE